MSYIVQDLPHFSDVIWVVYFVREVVYIEYSHQKWSSASTWDSALQWVDHDICQKWKRGSLKDIWKMLCFLCYKSSTLILIRSWVALSSKVVSLSVSQASVTPVQSPLFAIYKAWMSSTDPVSSITNCYRLIVSFTDPVHSFIIS